MAHQIPKNIPTTTQNEKERNRTVKQKKKKCDQRIDKNK